MATLIVDPAAHPHSATCGIGETIEQLGGRGGAIVIPAGRYELRRAIHLPQNVTIRGEGSATVLTRPAPAISDLLTDCDQVDRAQLADTTGLQPGDQLRIMDDRQPMYHSREMVIRTLADGWITGERLYGEPDRVYRVADHAWAGNLFPALSATRVAGITIESLVIEGGEHRYDENRTGDFLGAAIHCLKVQDLRIGNVTVRRWPGDGISVQGGSAMVSGCVVEDCLGSALHPGSNLHRSVWIGNIARGNRHGLFFCSTVRNTIAAHNILIANREHGIWGLGDPDMGNVLVGNIIADNGRHGIEAQRARANVIVANLMRANNRDAAHPSAAIFMREHRENLVANNLCLDDQQTPTQTDGLNIDKPAGDNLIQDNACFINTPPLPETLPGKSAKSSANSYT